MKRSVHWRTFYGQSQRGVSIYICLSANGIVVSIHANCLEQMNGKESGEQVSISSVLTTIACFNRPINSKYSSFAMQNASSGMTPKEPNHLNVYEEMLFQQADFHRNICSMSRVVGEC